MKDNNIKFPVTGSSRQNMIEENGENEKLITLDEFISKAKKLGVDFGSGDPRNRLRYYIKIGLLPHAKRKSFNGLPPTGAYSLNNLELLLKIDKKIKEGKNIQQIKRELIEEKSGFSPLILTSGKKEPKIKEDFKAKERLLFLKNFFVKTLIIFLIFFIFGSVFYLTQIKEKNFFYSSLTALLPSKLAREEGFAPGMEKIIEKEIEVLEISSEPYLTINAQTEITGPLLVKEKITTPVFLLTKENFQGSFALADLTTDRNYIFPDQSGTVCLSTGNCVGLAGEVISRGAIVNRLTKFLSANRIGSSSINDLYSAGISITIDSQGRVGIGTANPRTKLEVAGDFITPNFFVGGGKEGKVGVKISNPQYDFHVGGRIQATGDICTDLGGGKCLSQFSLQQAAIFYGGAGGLKGSGESNYLPLWSGKESLTNSIVYQNGSFLGIGTTNANEKLTVSGVISLEETEEPSVSENYGKIYVAKDGKLYFKDENNQIFDLTASGIGGSGAAGQVVFWSDDDEISGDDDFFWDIENKKLGIGTKTPAEKLEVAGTIKMTGFYLPTGAQSSYVLTSDGSGFGTWQPAPSGTMPSGQLGYTLWHNGTSWVANDFLYNNGTKIGINTQNPTAVLTIASNSFPQFLLKYDNQNYFQISTNNNSTEISSSKKMILNSLTGEIVTGDNVTLFDALNSGATIKALTFISADNDSTVRKSGEKVFRSSIPLFKFPIASQTKSTSYISLTREITPSVLNSVLPDTLPGSVRKFAFLLNFSDDIPSDNFSYWIVDVASSSDIEFSFSGQNSSLEEGNSHLSPFFNPPSENWYLKVKAPSNTYNIRVFNVFLVVFDEIQ